jgi:hypothetical protein
MPQRGWTAAGSWTERDALRNGTRRTRKRFVIRENQALIWLAWPLAMCHIGITAKGRPEAAATGETRERGRRETRDRWLQTRQPTRRRVGFRREHLRVFGASVPPHRPRSVRFRRTGADLGSYQWTRRLQGPRESREHPKGASASLGFLVVERFPFSVLRCQSKHGDGAQTPLSTTLRVLCSYPFGRRKPDNGKRLRRLHVSSVSLVSSSQCHGLMMHSAITRR